MPIRFFVLALLLAGCQPGSTSDAGPPPATPATPEASDMNDASKRASGESDAGAEPSDTRPTHESVYTDLDLDACELLEEEPGLSASLRCDGYQGIDLYVTDGDGRMDVDVGVPNDTWSSKSGFNSLGEKAEWRLHGGTPIALIIRYNVSGVNGEERPVSSDLAVISVGTEGAPGCLVGWVPANARPSQNEAARVLADERAATVDCASGDA